jgi:DNA-binding XRE family transcriptional regulator
VDKKQFIEICDSKIRIIRTEYELSQEKMAEIIGISKKTLVEIEKGRSSLGWTGSVALCSIFESSEVINSAFGGASAKIVYEIAFKGMEVKNAENTGSIWWQTIMQNDLYQIQQNIVSQHYRLITRKGTKIASSFELEDLTQIYENPRQ